MIDGSLRKIFRVKFAEAHWNSVETGMTGLGIPDSEYCFPPSRTGLEGASGWVEFKLTHANKVRISPEQVAWAERRVRVGGRCWMAVRQTALAGPRRTARDALFLYWGTQVRAVLQNGLVERPWGRWEGGPARWNWVEIRQGLTAKGHPWPVELRKQVSAPIDQTKE